LPPDVIAKLKEATEQVLAEATTKDPLVKKVHDSFMAFKATHDKWAAISEAVYQSQIRGQLKT
jgi:TRAP-type mannitol/chloroaromatic compound transport system substrate-binding protein